MQHQRQRVPVSPGSFWKLPCRTRVSRYSLKPCHHSCARPFVMDSVNIAQVVDVDWKFGGVCCQLFALSSVRSNRRILCLDLKWAHRALCVRCAKGRQFFTTSSHGSQGPRVLNSAPPMLF